MSNCMLDPSKLTRNKALKQLQVPMDAVPGFRAKDIGMRKRNLKLMSGLCAEPKSIDLGSVKLGEMASVNIQLLNRGVNTAFIRIKRPCEAIRLIYKKGPIPAGLSKF